MAYKADSFVYAFYGSTRTGKSTGVKELLNKIKINRVLVFDPMNEYSDLKGFIPVYNSLELSKVLKKKWNKGFKIAYIPRNDKRIEEFNSFCGWVRQMQNMYFSNKDNRQVLLIVEELNEIFPNTGGSLPAKSRNFGELCSRGGHYGVNLIGVTQRPAEVHARFRGQVRLSRVYRLAFNSDIKTIKDMCFSKIPALNSLEPHNYLEIQFGKTEMKKNDYIKK